jgi:uncharacterized protein (DUF305 family)
MTAPQRIAALLVTCVVTAAGAACRTGGVSSSAAGASPSAPIIQPGAPGESSHVLTADTAVNLPQPGFTAADVKFMQGMISHHAQAIEMTELLPTRTNSEEMRKLALRIAVSQADEIKMMQHWLEARGQEVPGPHAMHMHGATLMPGMLTSEEMTRLAEAKGTEFDRRFLEGMIKHHGGALTMVQDLFSTPGAGQEAEIFAFASDVDADQRMEIDRMDAMLKELPK